MFCLDSESFRYLAALKSEITLTAANDEDFRMSWGKSSHACRNFMHKVKTIEPHKVNETVTLNKVRSTILHVAQPLAEISKHIQQQITNIELEKDLIEKYKGNLEALKERLMVDVTEIEHEALDYPRTVCTHPNCTTIHKADDGSFKRVALRPCHNHCYLDSVELQSKGDPLLSRCASMVKNQTQETAECECGHSFREHMHEKISYKIVKRKREDEATKIKIQEEKSKIKTKEDVMKSFSEEQKRWEKDQDFVLNSMARFGTFLSNNGLLAYNDAMEDYLKLQIEEQEDIAKRLPIGESNKDMVVGLQERLKEYYVEKQILDDALKKEDSGVNTDFNLDDLQKTISELT